MQNFLSLIFCFLFLFSCSTSKVSKTQDAPRESIHQTFEQVKSYISQKNYVKAKEVLDYQSDNELSEVEKAEKYNLLGVISQNQGDFKNARDYYGKALSFDFQSDEVQSKILLNLSSVDLKLGDYQVGLGRVRSINPTKLTDDERNKLFQIKYLLGKGVKSELIQCEALFELTKEGQGENEILNDKYFRVLSSKFATLDHEQQLTFFNTFKGRQSTVLKILLQRTKNYYDSTHQEDRSQEIAKILGDFKVADSSAQDKEERLSFSESIDSSKVGLILPLSGDKAEFSAKVIAGVQLALKNYKNVKLIVRDSQNSAAVAKMQIQKLISEEEVAIIIGGLFPNTSVVEFEAATKFGALYISLAPVYKNKNLKNHLLIELPGSVESQVYTVLSPAFTKKIGSQFAVLFSEDDQGQAYADSFWGLAPVAKAELNGLSSYPQSTTDFREPIKNLMGLKYSRERLQEYELWNEIYNTKFKGKIDRVQVLRPEIDFQWVFIPSNQQELIQIIPTFQYLEAKNLVYVGGPSWRSSALIKKQKLLGKLYFVDVFNDQEIEKFNSLFKATYGRDVKLLEMLGFESISLAGSILGEARVSKRSALSEFLMEEGKLSGFVGKWKLREKLWIRDMTIQEVTETGFSPVTY
jgi:tetratricopeptide (TPR) repeat protein